MLRRYRFELILILLIICAVVATRFSSINCFAPSPFLPPGADFPEGECRVNIIAYLLPISVPCRCQRRK